jgi:diguanylate cyclase (GGDEF)-like protein
LGFSVIFIDVDHFKRINDGYGHDMGDKVLQRIAATLQANMRSYDMVGRWGGEEFMVLIRYVNPEQSLSIAQKLCYLVGNTYVTHQDERIGTTVTMGVTDVRPGDTVEELIQRADRLMYDGKQQGRNRAVFG